MTRALVMASLFLLAFATNASAQVREGERLDVTVETITGDVVQLGADDDRIVIVEFWATWCSPCRRALPALSRLAAEHGDVRVVAISIDDRLRRVEKATRGLALDVVWDRRQALLATFSPPAIPTTYIIDRDGYVSAILEGFESIEDVAVAVDHARRGAP